jgi:heat shock protein HslJ
MEQEAAFLELLPEVGGYSIEDDLLYLEDDARQVIAELEAY